MPIGEIRAWFLIVAAAVSAAFVCVGIWNSRRTAKQKESLNFINEYNNNRRIEAAHQLIRKTNKDGNIPEAVKQDGQDRADFLFLINMF